MRFESVDYKIEYSDVVGFAHLTWKEIWFGVENRLLDNEVVVHIACDALQNQNSEAILALASLDSGECVRPKLWDVVCANSSEPPSECLRVWTFFLLEWVYNHRHDYEKPLEVVALVYADLEYPTHIRELIHYMPSSDESVQAYGESVLMKRWVSFLEAERQYFLRRG